jgi:hypothetical protein
MHIIREKVITLKIKEEATDAWREEYDIWVGWALLTDVCDLIMFNPSWVGQALLDIYLLLGIILYPTLRVAPNSPNVLVFEDLLHRFLVKIKSSLDVHPHLPMWVLMILQHPVFACVNYDYFTLSLVSCVGFNHFTTSHVSHLRHNPFYNILCLPMGDLIILKHLIFPCVRHNLFYHIPCLHVWGQIHLITFRVCPCESQWFYNIPHLLMWNLLRTSHGTPSESSGTCPVTWPNLLF